ncbi:MAG: RsmD family RNA methyltransferase [Candidatus Saccharimonadales bacterium]
MRIIAGYLKGRIFRSPANSRTHPMSDKIRGALFNMLGDIEGLRVLDAFSGSGAVSFEAISRGVALTVALESDRQAQKTLAANITDLDVGDKIEFIQSSASAWLATSDDVFDIVILDPPYDNIQQDTILFLAKRTQLKGLVVMSLPVGTSLKLPSEYELLRTKLYGYAQLLVYRRMA